jgi:hypothetical protein
MEDKKYNGWATYETWLVGLWLDNDQGSYEYWREQAQEQWKSAPTCKQVLQGYWTAAEAAKFNLADQIKEEIADASPLTEADMFCDLLNAAFSEVNWQEVAEKYLEEFEEADAAPQEDETPEEEEELRREAHTPESQESK